MNADKVRVVVPDEPLDTSDPVIAKALLDLLLRLRKTASAHSANWSTGGFTHRENRERDSTAALPADPGSPAALEAAG